MIYRLRKRFILVSTISILIVFFAIFFIMLVFNSLQLNHTMDTLTDAIASNDGFFPPFDRSPELPMSGNSPYPDVITEESEFSTRFFTVWLDNNQQIRRVNMDSIDSISEELAGEYTAAALADHTEKGWVGDYRYRVFTTEHGAAIVFVNGALNRAMSSRFLFTSSLILAASGLIILILIILISKRVVRPIAESEEKQKQFITDANHELKTPLTLILSNLDIVEAELGKNEWLEDIRIEGERMGVLIQQLVTLSRMDEDPSNLARSHFDLSSACMDTVSEFKSLAADRGKTLNAEVEPGLSYFGDEELIRRLLSILLDNAVKYCDPEGCIQVFVHSKKRHPLILVENSCQGVDQIELKRLFDRFYRANRARTFDGSFGIGLSIAKAIAKSHHGDISAYQKDQLIGFRVELK